MRLVFDLVCGCGRVWWRLRLSPGCRLASTLPCHSMSHWPTEYHPVVARAPVLRYMSPTIVKARQQGQGSSTQVNWGWTFSPFWHHLSLSVQLANNLSIILDWGFCLTPDMMEHLRPCRMYLRPDLSDPQRTLLNTQHLIQ